MTAVKETPGSGQGTRMNRLQHQMLLPVDAGTAFLGRVAPGEEHDPTRAFLRHYVDDLLCEALPAFVAVAVGFVGADGQAGVEHEDASVGPWSEETAVLWRRFEVGVVLLQRCVHVLQAGWCWGWRPHGEAKTVSLVEVMVWILTYYHSLDVVKRSVAGPEYDFC